MDKILTEKQKDELLYELTKSIANEFAEDLHKETVQCITLIQNMVDNGYLKNKWDCVQFAAGCFMAKHKIMPVIVISLIDKIKFEESKLQ